MQATQAEPNLSRAFEMVMELMAIFGKTGNEAEVAAYIKTKLLAAGYTEEQLLVDATNQKTPTPSNTGNLILTLPGTVDGPRRLLSAHMDTVPICVGSQPVVNGRFVHSADPTTGLGADDRAGTAVLLSTALEIIENNLLHPPLTFCWFIQEETGMHGARLVSKDDLSHPELAFNWDGGAATKLSVGATGSYRIRAKIEGLASHAGGAPEKGVSAIAIAAHAIAHLDQNGWHGKVVKSSGEGTSNVGFIAGGEATNVVTDLVHVRAEARSHDPDFRKEMLTQIEGAFLKAAEAVTNVDGAAGKVTFDNNLVYESFRLADDDPSLLEVEKVIRGLGLEPERSIANGGLDANWLTANGIPSVTMGCGQQDPHTVNEMLNLDEFDNACRIGLRLATQV
ncbi:MAG: M20/M25/M40 family metallo-hydrolase [Chloroflexota bacterium]